MEPESKEIKHTDTIVTFAKRVSREVASFRIPKDIDFIGCSEPYVREKLNAAIYDLQWLKRTLTALDKSRRTTTAKGE